MSNSLNAEPKFNQEEIARYLLDSTKTLSPATNERLVASYLNLRIETYNRADKYNLPESIRAFIAPNQRLIGVSELLTPKQRKFSILHEIGHFILPGHATHPELIKKDGIIRDTGSTLSTNSTIQLEIEANQFAADMIFQLERFDRRVNSQELTWKNIQHAADEYDASFEATARRWVEKSLNACALFVFSPIDKLRPATPLEVTYTVTSKPFRQKYFDRLIQGTQMDMGTAVFEHYHSHRDDIKEAQITVNTAGGEPHIFNVHLFSNSYREFALATP